MNRLVTSVKFLTLILVSLVCFQVSVSAETAEFESRRLSELVPEVRSAIEQGCAPLVGVDDSVFQKIFQDATGKSTHRKALDFCIDRADHEAFIYSFLHNKLQTDPQFKPRLESLPHRSRCFLSVLEAPEFNDPKLGVKEVQFRLAKTVAAMNAKFIEIHILPDVYLHGGPAVYHHERNDVLEAIQKLSDFSREGILNVVESVCRGALYPLKWW